ncbi:MULTISPECIES: FHA domain-containing protein [Streptomyces]|uniref:FHA domain-containing protein n=2 Tax=Streptomyces TaxID=1883 RepID=A0ABV9ILZ2_9ACTN
MRAVALPRGRTGGAGGRGARLVGSHDGTRGAGLHESPVESVHDKNSTNGTTVNGAEDLIAPFVPVPLKDGDRVHVGLWTTITIHRD